MTTKLRVLLALIVFGLSACGGSGGGSGGNTSGDNTPTTPNAAPSASAGADQVVDESTFVTLDGSNSNDSDGTISSYFWEQTTGSGVALTGANTQQASFLSPSTDDNELLTFRLTVTDNLGLTNSDSVNITVNNAPIVANQVPIVVAESNIFADEHTTIQLDASDSYDPDGDTLSFLWEGANGQTVAGLSNANSAIASLELSSSYSHGGSESLRVTVTDVNLSSSSQNVIVWVQNTGNIDPIADAGDDNVVAINQETSLSSSGSYDPDGQIIRYEWRQLSGPTVTLSHYTSPAPTFTPTEAGELAFELTVLDNDSSSATDTVTITVDAENIVPVIVHDGASQDYDELVEVELRFESVSDPDGSIVNYEWRQVGTADGVLEILDSDQEVARFIAPEVSETAFYDFLLAVTDNDGATITSPFLRISISPVDVFPVADAGSDLSVDYSTTIYLSSEESSDEDGNIVSHSWTQIIGPSVTLFDSDTSSPSFESPAVETVLGFEVTVIDNHNNIATDTLLVHVVGDSLSPNIKRVDSPGRIDLTWNEVDGPTQYNLYYAKGREVNSDNYHEVANAVVVTDITQPYSLPAAFNEYQNVYFTVEAVQVGEVVKSGSANTELKDIALNPTNTGGCTIEGGQVLCWGLFSDEHPIFETVNPSKVLVNGFMVCVLDDIGVRCLPLTDNASVPVIPALINPQDMYINGTSICILDETGRICVGSVLGQDTLPTLDSPQQLAGECMIDITGLVCAESFWLLDSAPSFSGVPDQVEVVYTGSGGHACALENSNVSCWGESVFMPIGDVPTLINPRHISAGTGHACAVDDFGVVCWGDSTDRGEQDVPSLNNPRRVEVGRYQTCAIDDDGLHCWGSDFVTYDGDSQNIDSLKLRNTFCAIEQEQLVCGSDSIHEREINFNNVIDFAIGEQHACVINDGEVDCWGWSSTEVLTVPDLSNPRLVSVGTDFSCAVDDTGVNCWGTLLGTFDYPDMSGITALSSNKNYTCAYNGSDLSCWDKSNGIDDDLPSMATPLGFSLTASPYRDSACALDENAVKCWNNPFDADLENAAPILVNPSQISVGQSHACALDELGVSCWGANYSGQAQTPTLTNPTLIETGRSYSCALDDNGLICWGYGAFNRFGWRANPIY